MRFIVKYEKPGQIEGARLFDVVGVDHVTDAVREAGVRTAGVGATIIEIVQNDGTIPFESEAK